MGLTNAQYKLIIDDVLNTKRMFIDKQLMRGSKVLQGLMKTDDVLNDSGKVSGIQAEDFGRSVKIDVVNNYPVIQSTINQFNIRHGDEKKPKISKSAIQAEINAVDKGFAISVTTKDLQLIKGEGSTMAKKFINYIERMWTDMVDGMKISLVNSIYNGLGDSATNADGETKEDFIGLYSDGTNGIIGTASYGGKSYTNWAEWQSKLWDMNSDNFGYTASSSFATIAQCITLPTGKMVTPFYDVLQKAVNRMRQFSKRGRDAKFAIIMHPAVYEYLFLPSLESMWTGKILNAGKKMTGDTQMLPFESEYYIGNTPILVEDTMIPTTDVGGAPAYVYPQQYIHIVDFDELHLWAESSNNFAVTDTEPIQSQYNVAMKSLSTTLIFFASRRLCHGRIKLHDTTNAALTTAYGSIL